MARKNASAGGRSRESTPSGVELWRLVRRAAHSMTAEETRSLKDLGLTLTQYMALKGLEYSLGQSSARMARCLGISPQAAQTLTQRLGKMGWIERHPDAYSPSVIVNQVTESGTALLAEADERLSRIEADRRERLGGEEYDGLLAILRPSVIVPEVDGTAEQVEAQRLLQELVRSRLGASLRNLTIHQSAAIEERLRAGDTALNPTQFMVLDALGDEEPRPASWIARETGLSPQTASVTLTALRRDGLVRSEPSPNLASMALHSLTPAGADCQRAARERLAPCFAWPGAGTTDDDAAQVYRTIAILVG